MYRDIQIRNIVTNHYLMGVVIFITSIYSGMLYLTIINPYSPDHQLIVTILQIPLQTCFFMVLWSMIRSIISDPGKVPIYWGVLMDDQESKKRRYCLICHIFKPERCHHCSTCQRCVLNMDHHCPWIGNCVGYQNRKFFILFLFYINVTVLVSFITLLFKVVPLITVIINDYRIMEQDLRIPLTLLLMTAIIVFGVVIFNFFTFHIELVNTNKTTIDTLEMRRNNTPIMNNFYDIGWKENWLQVFGTRKRLWFFPMFGESGRPQGDGVHWERNANIVTVTEQNLTHRTQTQQRVESQPAR